MKKVDSKRDALIKKLKKCSSIDDELWEEIVEYVEAIAMPYKKNTDSVMAELKTIIDDFENKFKKLYKIEDDIRLKISDEFEGELDSVYFEISDDVIDKVIYEDISNNLPFSIHEYIEEFRKFN